MAHLMKHNASASGHMTKHYERAKDSDGNYIKFSNQDIDTNRTHLNYNIAGNQQLNQMEFIRQRCSQVRCQNRKDVNVMCSWVITAPKDLPEHEQKYFFKASYDFLANRYGRENVVSAYVHLDETTPHMHFAFVPVTEDKKRDCLKVSAKEVVNRKDLQTFHNDLQKHLECELGHPVNILNEATKDGNKTVSELKRQTCLELTRKAEEEALSACKMASSEQAKLNELISQKTALIDDIDRLTAERDILTKAEVEAIKGEKNLVGGLKGVTYKEFESLKRTAVMVESMAAERDQALARANEADLRAANAYADATQQLRARIREVEQDRPSLKAQQDIIRLKHENEALQKDLKRYKTIASDLAEIVRTKLPEVYKMLLRTPEKQSPEKAKSKSRSDELSK